MKRILAICLVVLAVTEAAADVSWVRSRGSCAEACGRAGLRPVVTGFHKGRSPFYLCATNAMGEGARAGYNLDPDWSNACWVGYGGKEVPSVPFQCLCQDRRAIAPAE